MGWKRALRNLDSANRQAQKQRERQSRTMHREIDRLETKVADSVSTARHRIERIEEKIRKDPLKILRPRYSAVSGLTCEPLQIDCGLITLTVSFAPGDTAQAEKETPKFHPKEIRTEIAFAKPLDVILTEYAIIVAISVACSDASQRPRLNWVRKSDRTKSLVFLTDPDSNEYYYPISTDLPNELVGGTGVTALIAFEPLRATCQRLRIHFSDRSLPGEESALDIEYSSDGLLASSNRVLAQPSLTERAEEYIRQFHAKATSEVEGLRAKASSKSGCLVFVLIPGIFFTVLALVEIRLLGV